MDPCKSIQQPSGSSPAVRWSYWSYIIIEPLYMEQMMNIAIEQEKPQEFSHSATDVLFIYVCIPLKISCRSTSTNYVHYHIQSSWCMLMLVVFNISILRLTSQAYTKVDMSQTPKSPQFVGHLVTKVFLVPPRMTVTCERGPLRRAAAGNCGRWTATGPGDETSCFGKHVPKSKVNHLSERKQVSFFGVVFLGWLEIFFFSDFRVVGGS